MLGAVLMKRGKDGKEHILSKEDVNPAEGSSRLHVEKPPTDTVVHEDYYHSLGRLGLALLSGSFGRPKTYERLIHDIYVAGWTIEEVKTLLNGGKLEEKRELRSQVDGAAEVAVQQEDPMVLGPEG